MVGTIPHTADKLPWHRWIARAIILGLSVTLLVVGGQYFWAELMLVPGNPIYLRLSGPQPVSKKDMATLEQSRLNAIQLVSHPKAYNELGSLYLARAYNATSPEDINHYTQMSIDASNVSLSLAPLNTFAWYRLAAAYTLLGPDHFEEAASAWQQSVASAHFEPYLLHQRIHVGIILHPALSAQALDLLRNQIELAYQWNPESLHKYAKRYNLIEIIILVSGPESEAAKLLTGK